jgi:tetratricopeptide (TPR) repeat protein
MLLKKYMFFIEVLLILLVISLPVYAETIEDWISKGDKLCFEECNYEEAIKYYDKILEIDPTYTKALVGKGISLGFLDKYQEALKYIDKALEYNPKYDYGYYGKGVILGLQDKYQEALKYFDKALGINSKYSDVFTDKAVTLGVHGKYEEAFKYINKGLEINPNDAHLLNGKGVILLLQEKPEEAIKYFDKALKVNPKYVKALENKGISLSLLGKYEEGIKYCDEVLKINFKNSFAWIIKGNALSNLKRNKEAIKCFDTAIKLKPQNSNIWFYKALTLERQGKYEEAIKCYDKTIELNSKYADAWNNKGVILGNSEKYEEAIKCFDKAIEIDPEYTDALNNKQIVLKNVDANKKNEECIQGNDKIAESNNIKIKDLKTLVIHIASTATDSKYNGYVCLKDGVLYTYLEDLKQHMLFNYEYSEKKLKVHLSSSTIEYNNSMIREGPDIYIPLITFCHALGFNSNYSESTNILEIKQNLKGSTTFGSGSDDLIVPKVRMGNIYLFMTTDQLIKQIGEPDKVVPAEGYGYTLYYHNYKLIIDADLTYKIRMIISMNPYLSDRSGIAIGADIDTVLNCYPGNYLNKDSIVDLNQGIIFDFNSKGMVDAISICDPGYYEILIKYFNR